jgi:hypothetical protein
VSDDTPHFGLVDYLADRYAASASLAEFETYVAALRTAQKRKRKLLGMLDAPGLGG